LKSVLNVFCVDIGEFFPDECVMRSFMIYVKPMNAWLYLTDFVIKVMRKHFWTRMGQVGLYVGQKSMITVNT